MKKIHIILSVITLSLIFTSCYNVEFNNPNDKYSDVFIRDNAKLSNIIISDGELSPAFNSDNTVYIVNLSYLISSITVTPESVNNHSTIIIDGVPIDSGYTSDSIYIDYGDKDILINVTSEDETNSITYTVKLIRYKNNDNDFHAFNLLKVNNNALVSDIIGIINTTTKTVKLTVPYGTTITDLIATYNVGDFTNVEIEGVQQESGITHIDFSSSVIYSIIAQDGSQSNYKVDVSIALNTDNDFKTFRFLASKNSEYLSEDVTGVIDTNLAKVTLNTSIFTNDITALVASYTIGDYASVTIKGVPQISGVTVNNFSNVIKYTITAQNGLSKTYTINFNRGYLEAYLKAPNNLYNFINFGSSVSISGDTAIVGAPGENSTTTTIINGSDLSLTNNYGAQNGAVYVFKRNNSIWSHETYLKAPNNTNSDKFGSSVAISGDTIAVGAPFEGSNTTSIINGADLSSTNYSGTYNGAVYIYRRSGNIWTHEAYLKAPNNSDYDEFGFSVAISGDTIAICAPLEQSSTNSIINGSDLSTTNNDQSYSGAVYIFRRSGNIWAHEAYLKAPNNYFTELGTSISISGDTIAVGAEYEMSTTNSIINGTDLSSTNHSGAERGAVYVFKRSGNIWSHEAYLKAPNNSPNLDIREHFGSSISIFEDTIVVGAPDEASKTTNIINGVDLSSTNTDGLGNGAVYVFKRNSGIWSHEAYLKAPNNSNGDNFGSSVSILGDTIVVGAPNESSITNNIINGSDLSSTNNGDYPNGAVYLFKRSGNIWTHKAYLKAPNNSREGDNFGNSVSISGGIIAVGALYEPSETNYIINGSNLNGTNNWGSGRGAVYIFR